MADAYTDPDLARSQHQIVEILSTASNSEDLLTQIAAADIQADLKQWLLSCDPTMLETAASLVSKWGSDDPDHGVGL